MSEIFTPAFWGEYGGILAEGLLDTLIMVAVSTLFAYLIGLPMGVISVLTQPHGIRPHRAVNAILVDAGVIEAARSMGASTFQTVWKVYLPEAMPSLILGGSITLIAIVGYTAIAGMVGAGGLGDLAIRYGHQRHVPSVMWVTVVILIILVQVVQSVFSRLSVRIDKRLK